MAKKSFKNSARDSVASAFFSDKIEQEKDIKDTQDINEVLDTKNMQETQDIQSNENTQDTQNAQDVREVQNAQDTTNTQNISNVQSVSSVQTETLPPYRINLKLKGEYKEYLDQVSWENRMSITAYLNELIEKDRQDYLAKKEVNQ